MAMGRNSGRLTRKVLWSGILITGVLLLFYDPMRGVYPKSFARDIGIGVAKGIDINRVVLHFFLFYFVLFPLALGVVFWLLRRLYLFAARRNPNTTPLVAAGEKLALLALPLLVVAALQNFDASAAASRALYLVFWLLVLGWAYLGLAARAGGRTLSPGSLLWAALCALQAAYPVFLALRAVCERLGVAPGEWAWVAAVVLLWLVLVGGLHVLRRRAGAGFAAAENRLRAAFIPLLFAPLAMSLYVEARNVLAARGVLLHSPYRDVLLLYAAAAVLAAAVWLVLGRKKEGPAFRWHRLYFPVVVASVFLVGVQIPYTVDLAQSFFEQGNYGVPLSQLVLYGHLPIVETFSAHMLSDVLGRPLFALLNGDLMAGAIGSYVVYLNLAVALSLYYILSRLWNRAFALGFLLLFPYWWAPLVSGFTGMFSITLPSLGMLPVALVCVVAMLRVLRRPGWKSYALYALALAFSCVYALDNGLAFAVGTLAALLVLRLTRRGEAGFSALRLLGCLAALALACLGFFVAVCLIKDIPVAARLGEFLAAAMSNGSWSFGDLGDPAKTGFSFYYLFIPLAVVGGLLFLLRGEFARNKKPPLVWAAVSLALGLAYVVNLQRAFVRHNFFSLDEWVLMYTAPLFLACVAAMLVKKHKMAVFLGVPLALALCSNSMITLDTVRPASALDWAAGRFTAAGYLPELSPGAPRYALGAEGEQFTGVTAFLNETLEGDETFLDLTNQGLLYTVTGRECPVYVSQSPSLVSGEFAQRRFVAEAEAMLARTPLALTATDEVITGNFMDGLYHSTKHYLLYEYLYQNYVPLGVIEDRFVVWCRADRYGELAAGPAGKGLAPVSDQALCRTMGPGQYLLELPYLWANADTQNAAGGAVLQTLSQNANGVYPVDTGALPAGSCYLRLDIEAAADMEGALSLDGAEEPLTYYHFNLHEGRHSYLLRMSSNYFWHSGGAQSVTLYIDAQVHELSVIQGD